MPKGPVSVRQDSFRQGKVQGQEEGGPVDAMESDNVLADHMDVCRPACGMLLTRHLEGVVGFGEVVDQGV